MIPWVHLDTAKVPGGDELKLMRRGSEFSIMTGSTTLMNSRMSGSEIALAELTCDRVGGRRNCRMLIGGYGMGFTLRAALSVLRADAQIVVAELVPASSGRGYISLKAMRGFEVDTIFMAIAIIGILGILTDQGFRFLRLKLTPWAKQ